MQADDALKKLYKSDSTEKKLLLNFYHRGESEPFLGISGDGKILGDSLKLSESLSCSENLDFGSCEASQLDITLIDVEEDIKGAELEVSHLLSLYPSEDLYPSDMIYPGGYAAPMGRFIVQSADRGTNRRYRDMIALDYMTLFDVDVIDWYNSLEFPMLLQDFRASLCAHVGVVEEVPSDLPNDDLIVEKTIDASTLIGRDVLIACEQINGAFGHFDRNGVLQHIVLAKTTEETTVSDEDMEAYLCISCGYEEYAVQSIDKVQIRQEEGDIGAIYGEGTNCYTVEGNFLVYGKSAEELEQIAQGIYSNVTGCRYVPCELNSKGLPYLEVGNLLWVDKDEFFTYLMKRTLTGIFALKDSISSTGEEIRSVENNVNTEIIQLKGKSAILTRNVEEISAKVTDLGEDAETLFTLTAELAELKVSKGEVSSQISVESGQVYIGSNRLVVDSTNFQLDADGNATFSGNVTGATINGSKFKSETFYADDEEVIIGDFYVSVDETYRFAAIDGSIVFKTADDPGGNSHASLTIGVDGNQVYLGMGTGRFDQTVYADSFYGEGTATSNLYDLKLRKSWWEGVSITDRVQFLSDCLWELASIIDSQWSDYSGVYDELETYFDDNKPW